MNKTLPTMFAVVTVLLGACSPAGDTGSEAEATATGTLAPDEPEEPTTAGELEVIDFWYQESVFGAPLFVGFEKGWYEEALESAGYSLNTEATLGASSLLEAVAAGEADVVELGVAPAVSAIGQGLPIKMVMTTNIAGESIVVHPESDIDSISDLAGKTVGVHARGSMQDFIMRKALADAGMSGSDVSFVDMGIPDQMTALANREIDVALLAEPFTTQLELDGTGRVLAWGHEVWPGHDNQSISVTESLIGDDPEAVRIIVEQTVRGLEYIRENPEESQEITADILGIDHEVVVKSWANVVRPEGPELNVAHLEEYANDLAENGFIPEPIPGEDMVDHSFVS